MSAVAYAPSKWLVIKGQCPACGHKGGYCTVTSDSQAILCRRNSAGKPIKQRDGSFAYLFPASAVGSAAAIPAQSERARLTKTELKGLRNRFAADLSNKRLAELADSLKLRPEPLTRMGVGWDVEHGAYSFPMYDGEAKLCGFRLRPLEAGKPKKCVYGSSNGLFIPTDYSAEAIPEGVADDPYPLLILLPEGPTDTAAILQLGFRAIGRPNNSGGGTQLRTLLGAGDKQDVVIVADRDETKFTNGEPYYPGIQGALGLASDLLPVCGRLRFMLPPDGAKDLRCWVNAGGSELFPAIARASIVTPEWLRRAWARVNQKKINERKNAPTASVVGGAPALAGESADQCKENGVGQTAERRIPQSRWRQRTA
jgi:hypothetical protein